MNSIDLIVMGTQGATGLRKIIIGINATAIIEKSPVQVMSVPKEYQLKLLSDIVLSTTYEEPDKHALFALLKNCSLLPRR